MLKVGLTGGIGCGKSAAVAFFRQFGVPVIEADLIAREVVAAGQPALQEIHHQFGPQSLLPDGQINRAWLRQQVFQDTHYLQELESILHPRIRQRILQGIADCPSAPYVVVDIPLLLEKGYADLFERILVVDCLPAQQIQRVRERDGSDEALVTAIIHTQISREERLLHADDIVHNQGSLADFYGQLERLHQQYSRLGDT